jgi:SSS family solute:Na+ symporter
VLAPGTGKHFGGSSAAIPFLDGRNGYIALTAFVLNVVIAVVGTLLLRAAHVDGGTDDTEPADYFADAGDPRVQPLAQLTDA